MDWEYHLHLIKTEQTIITRHLQPEKIAEALAEYGRQGWELASTVPYPTNSGTLSQLLLILKRPRNVSAPPVQNVRP